MDSTLKNAAKSIVDTVAFYDDLKKRLTTIQNRLALTQERLEASEAENARLRTQIAEYKAICDGYQDNIKRRKELAEADATTIGRLRDQIARLKPNAPQSGPDLRMVLSAREYQVLELLAEGLLYKEIASKLGISFETTHTYLRRTYSKLGVQSRTSAVVKFLNAR